MINFERFTLDNGLTVLFHQDKTTPMAVVNVLYNVGAKDEDEEKTGFAHLFEHLMFGGSINIPDFDSPLQMAGGENNAFTSNDITNYYEVLPKQNIETALWLESDRMLSLAFTEESLETQRKVVIEEFKQNYLNQPYGDVWLQLRPLAFKKHPYKWATIGKEIDPIANATIEDVKAFFKKHYSPSNAILCIAGNFELDEIKNLTSKYFADIPSGEKYVRNIEKEPKQDEYREKTVDRDVPANAFYYAFKMCNRLDKDFYTTDFLSDALGRDKSSRLYLSLKKDQQLVSKINCYILGSIEEGLLIISGRLNENVSFDDFDTALWKELEQVKEKQLQKEELTRIKNKIRTSKEFQEQGILNRAMGLCMYELLGDAKMINDESMHYHNITSEKTQQVAQSILRKENCSLLKIKAKTK